MSREHLYKAKHIDTGIWFEGDLIHDIDNFGEHRMCIYQALGKGRWQTVPVDDSTVCEYTGYSDLRKKKAFEHDIVFCEDGGCYGHIAFKNGKFLIEWEESRPDLKGDIHFWFAERLVYVIDNIFENPNILKGDGVE